MPDRLVFPDGAWIATMSEDESLRIWRAGTEHLLAVLRARSRSGLDPNFRRRTFGDFESAARRRSEACEACVPRFFETLGDAAAWERDRYLEAWCGYERCLR